MVQEIHIEGFEALNTAVEKYKGRKIFVLFTGSLGPDGKSWCGDCVTADPVIKQSLPSAAKDSILIHCAVGDRPYWKDQTNVFRKKLGITCVPTLMKWGEPKRLEEAECAKKELVEMLLEDE